MGYSCTDFVDTILDALTIKVPEEAWDDPEAQADLALAEIIRLQAIERDSRVLISSLLTMHIAHHNHPMHATARVHLAKER